MLMTLMLSFINACILPVMKHPLTLGLVLLIQTTLIALMTGFMNTTFWYSYIMLLIMIGGMLVLFMYMTNVASNEKFKFSTPLTTWTSFSLMILMATFIFTDQWVLNSKNLWNESLKINFYTSSLNKFLNLPAIMISATLIIYLLITLIIIIKIINIKHGPLRHSH